MAIEEPKKYDFLSLVAMDESDNESSKNQVIIRADPKSDNYKPESNQENLALMVGVGSSDKDNTPLDTKVSFEQAKANTIHIIRNFLSPCRRS